VSAPTDRGHFLTADIMHDNPPVLNLQNLARALGGEIVSNKQILCPGPGHSVTDRSLSVKIDPRAPEGFLVHSFAEDSPIQCRDYVREKAGLPAFKPNNGNGRRRATSDEIAALVASAVRSQRRDKIKQPSVTYQYTDESGTLRYQVLRYDNPKTFHQRRPDGNGGWIWNLNDVQRVLYRLPDLLQYPDGTVFVCEGEKDADRVADLGHCATTVASGRWEGVDISALTDRDIIILEDADDAGRKKALIAASTVHAVAKTVRIVRLPDLTGHPNNKDASDWLEADPKRAEKLVDVCFDSPIWEPSADTVIEEKIESVEEPDASPSTEKTPPETLPPLAFINIAAWRDQPAPERSWVVKDRVPLDNVTLLSGEGSVGKSILSLHLAVAVVLRRDWCSTMPEFGPVLVVACEDDAGELHRRLNAIVRHYGASFADLGDLHIISLAGQDALMATPNRNGLIVPTKLFKRVHRAACDIKPKLIVLDNSADIFGGAENDRAQVRQFIGLLRGLAMAANAGVLLTSHPSLTGISTGTGLSGSTAWNASVRSRLYFKRATTAKDEEPDPDLRVLEVMKSNYGPAGETITLRWKDGLFLPVAAPGSLERLAREQKVDELFLKLLDQSIDQGRNVSDKKTANAYAPGRFGGEPEAKAEHITKRELSDAMERLFRAGKIHVASYGIPSKGWTRIERK
jgi:RecA-family ATPase